jgi:hypothetical protein
MEVPLHSLQKMREAGREGLPAVPDLHVVIPVPLCTYMAASTGPLAASMACAASDVLGRHHACKSCWFFFVGYTGGKLYWLAIHSNQASLIVGGLRRRPYGTAATSRHAKRPYSRRCPAPGPKTAEELNPYTPLVCYSL